MVASTRSAFVILANVLAIAFGVGCAGSGSDASAMRCARADVACDQTSAAIDADVADSEVQAPTEAGTNDSSDHDADCSSGDCTEDAGRGNTQPPPTGGSFTFTSAGDHGWGSDAERSFEKLAAQNVMFHLALGDASYGDPGTEEQWCAWVKSFVGEQFPFQLIAGNHEEDSGADGHISKFAAYLPDLMHSVGEYGAQYYFDVNGLVRVIGIAADLGVNGIKYDYQKGTEFYNWLAQAIDDARAKSIRWIVVGMHKNCITAGSKSCEIGTDLMELLIDKRVDLVLQGHDHVYERSRQLSCLEEDNYVAGCVADDGADNRYVQGAGTVIVIAGSFGKGPREIDPSDPEYPYFAQTDQTSNGFVKFVVTAQSIDARFIASQGGYSDSFTIEAPPM